MVESLKFVMVETTHFNPGVKIVLLIINLQTSLGFARQQLS